MCDYVQVYVYVTGQVQQEMWFAGKQSKPRSDTEVCVETTYKESKETRQNKSAADESE